MAYITLANFSKIIFSAKISHLDLEGQLYKSKIIFYSKYEKNELLGIQELFKNPENYFNKIYKPFSTKDTFRYVYEDQQPAYHNDSQCPRLQMPFENFEIPEAIKSLGKEKVIEFRSWFTGVKNLLDRPDVYKERMRLKWGIETNPKAINLENSGSIKIRNYSLQELEKEIDQLLRNAERYATSNKGEIIKKFATQTYWAKKGTLCANHPYYSDPEIREILIYFDITYKKALKELLIEYYRLIYNPEIKMSGYLLDQLNFRPCSHCHGNNKFNEDKGFTFTWEFVLEHSDFFAALFSIHYPFSEAELLRYKNSLIFGTGYYSNINSSIPLVINAKYGLPFNQNIQWTERLRKLYYLEPYIYYCGEGTDETHEVNFEVFPLNPEEEIDFETNFNMNCANSLFEASPEEYEQADAGDILSKQRFENEYLKKDFTTEDILTAIENYENGQNSLIILHIFHRDFYRVVHSKLIRDVDFQIQDFLNRRLALRGYVKFRSKIPL